MQIFQDGLVFCWGERSQGGVYILRMQVGAPLWVTFGRFQQGQPIEVPVGDYLYVGSALGQRGSGSLARRLLRHASRSDAANPQPIREQMLALFPQIGLGPTPLHPPTGKKLRWHVDFLLDESGVELKMVYLIRVGKGNTELRRGDTEIHREKKKSLKSAKSVDKNAPRQLETAVSRHLLTYPQITPLVPGLGSTDDPGGTHLLKVTAVPDWWHTFPESFGRFLQSEAA
ncbi:MAG: DUF123 domain-containing protein [Candidatus Promineifilaceae bacterium]